MNNKDNGFLKPTIFATATLLVSTGIRNTIGLFVSPIVENTIMSLTDVSMAMAIGQFTFGLFQPLGGILTTKYRTFTILFSGAVCLIIGLLGIKIANTTLLLIICFGLLTPAGAAASSFPILIGHISKAVPNGKRTIVSGLINAGGSAGQFILAPLIQICINNYGYYGACIFLACAVVLSIIPSWFLCRTKITVTSEEVTTSNISDTILDNDGIRKELISVFKIPSYLFLHFGFFACGFHVAFLATHLPGEIGFYKYSGSVIALCFSILGICNIAGCVLVGILGKYIKLKNILTGLYTIRLFLIGIYLIVPKTIIVFIIFSIVAGFTFGATVPPTGDITARFVREKYFSTLFGMIFVTHQIGSFFGAWVGGMVMDVTGSFFFMWVIDASLSLLAAIISFKIKENGQNRV
ncbi:MFS transporter [Treponema primitia]|uniref:MFS transporter n=1 Tax=Treponema primitia TaxID=88058 RepID=UPI00397FD231